MNNRLLSSDGFVPVLKKGISMIGGSTGSASFDLTGLKTYQTRLDRLQIWLVLEQLFNNQGF